MAAFVERTACGLEAVRLATEVLQRGRLSHPTKGLWDSGDVQWWWRQPRASDSIDQPFWFDADGPVAGVLLTSWNDWWQLDVLRTPPDRDDPLLDQVWSRAVSHLADVSPTGNVEAYLQASDVSLATRVVADGFDKVEDDGEYGGTTWMAAADVPGMPELPDGYRLTDRVRHPDGPHWLAARNGPETEARLRQTSLYDPSLDMAIVTSDGGTAAYGLFWFDPVTLVGMLEPMRTADAHQRRGLGKSLVVSGCRRLAEHGAERLKVGYATQVAHALYAGAGFQLAEIDVGYRRTF